MIPQNPAFSFDNHIFDLDGTLLDSFPGAARTFATVTAPYGVSASKAEAMVYANTHMRFKDLFGKMFSEIGDTTVTEQDCVDMYAEFERLFQLTEADFFPGAIDQLRELRAMGKTLFLSTMSPDNLVDRRMHHGKVEDDLFAMRLGRTRLMKGPEHLQAFAAHLGTDIATFARSSAFWGDTAHDMHIARDAGIHAIGVIGTVSGEELLDAGAAIVIPSVASLISYVPL